MDKRIITREYYDNSSPFVLWESNDLNEYKRGALIDTFVCSDPECPALHMHIFSIDKNYRNMKFEGNYFKYELEIDGSIIKKAEKIKDCPLVLFIDIKTKELVPVKIGKKQEQAKNALLILIENLERPEVIELFRRRWRSLKRIETDDWKKRDWSWWTPGAKISWIDVFKDHLPMIFPYKDSRIIVNDNYCITPGCSCGEIALTFIKTKEFEAFELGVIFLNLKEWKITEKKPYKLSEKELEELWKEFQKSQPSLKRIYKERQMELMKIAPEIAKLSGNLTQHTIFEKSPAIGRNDPCPCGSGKKYKKCCLKTG